MTTINQVLFLRVPPYFGYANHHPHDITLPFTTAYAASILNQAGFQVTVLDLWANGWSLEKSLAHILALNPQAILYDCTTGVLPALKEINAALLNKISPRTLAFGAIPTFFPEALFTHDSGFEIGLAGECEKTVGVVMTALAQGSDWRNIPGLVYWDSDSETLVKTPKGPFLEDLDQLPLIDYHLFDLKRYRKFSFPVPIFRRVRWGHLLTTRGCPYHCSFCSHDHRQSFGRAMRHTSPKRVADEFEHLATRHGVNAISIEDDCFTVDGGYVSEICDELIRRNLGVKWVVQTRADLLDRPLMKKMKAAGCVGLSLGIESGSDRVLKVLKKGVRVARIRETLENATAEGLMLRLLFMIGNPGETEAEIEETIQLALSAQAITVQAHFCTPYPGTDFFDPNQDSLGAFGDFSSYNAIHRNMSQVSDERLLELRNRFYHSYYFSWHYLKLFMRQRLRYFPPLAMNDLPLIVRALFYLLRKPEDVVGKRSIPDLKSP
ncbi:MAG: radical SAM protein [Magnetococcales bacterium]|nr:radical SAM protein [Magnetococcales bacterium]